MKKVLVIGSTVVDIVINLEDHLPKTSEDVHVKSQYMSLGGCAYNVSDSIRHFGVPYTLFSPVGTGTYGHFVRESLLKQGITSPIPTPDRDNGCCYCFVEATGERTFISYHGAEYLFYKEWFDLINPDEVSSVYICGLEIEETTGDVIIDYLEQHPELTVYFAPGPRLTVIEPEKLGRLYALSPILHLNEQEALDVSHKATLREALVYLYEKTHNTVIVTQGKNGCTYYEAGAVHHVPGVKAHQADTIGAGDSHIGSIIACLEKGNTLAEAIKKANIVSAAVVETEGALLSNETFTELHI